MASLRRKKRKVRKNEPTKREYIIHIRKSDDEIVSAFSGNSWLVSFLLQII